MLLTIAQVVLGAIVAILVTITVENLRKPKLEIRIATPLDVRYPKHPASEVRFLRLELGNKRLPRLARWLSRNAAMQCYGTITFYHLDGQNVFGRSMPIRWSGSPEPVYPSLFIDGKQRGFLLDRARLASSQRMDVYPGETELLDVAGRFDNEDDCYGWSNESYFSDPIWRNPNWKLPKGRYLLKVGITSAGEKCMTLFRLVNDVPQRDFRIEPALRSDRTHD